MPSTLQEWLAVGIVALTLGFILGRQLGKRKQTHKQSDCHDCPQAKPPTSQFKNIPINVNNAPNKRDD